MTLPPRSPGLPERKLDRRPHGQLDAQWLKTAGAQKLVIGIDKSIEECKAEFSV
jgi:hypothetical protein